MDLQNALDEISAFAFAADVMSFIVVTIIAIKDHKLYSTFISLALATFIGFVTLQYEPILLVYAQNHLDYKALNRFVWYGGFMLINYAALYATLYIHRMRQIKLNPVSKLIVFGFFILICLNGLQYAEQILFDQNLLLAIYQAGTSGVSIVTSVLSAVYIVVTLIYIKKRKKGNLLWNF